MSIATEYTTIATEQRVLPAPRRTSPGRTPSQRRLPSQRRGSVERRRHVGLGVPQGGRLRDDQARCADAAHEPQRISWLAALLGIVATAAVILGFVAMANLRAASLEPASEGVAVQNSVSVVQDAGVGSGDPSRVGE